MICSSTITKAPLVTLLDRAMCEMTERVARMELKATDFVINNALQWESLFIRTRGDYEANLILSAEEPVFREIAVRMRRGREVTKSDIVIYVTEYYNIVCGFLVSHLNTLLNARARFGIPEFQEGFFIQKKQEKHGICLKYASEFGQMQLYAEGFPLISDTMKEKE